MAEYGEDFLTGGTATTSDDIYGDAFKASNGCDDNTATLYMTGLNKAEDQWWKYDLGAGITKTANRIRICIFNDSNASIKEWNLYGSNNDSEYAEITSGSEANVADNAWVQHDFENTEAYRYFKIIMHYNYPPGSWRPDAFRGFREIELREDISAPTEITENIKPNKKSYTGYNCFIQQYIKNKFNNTLPYKLPDGTLW